jgi:hypothetical protein
MRESRVESYLRRRCHEEGFECWKFNRPGKRAAFDRIVPMPNGRVIWVETKKTFGELSDAQRREQIWLEGLGHIAICINSREDVEYFVEEYLYEDSRLDLGRNLSRN